MSLRRETARHHTVVHTLIRRAGRTDTRIYVLYLLSQEGTAPAPMQPLVEYILEHGRTRSLAWQRELTRAVGLLVDFLQVNAAHFKNMAERPQVLAAFADALVCGTIDRDGADPSGLYWEPKSLARATVALNAITAFSDWLVNRYSTTALNPWKAASVAEQLAYWRRFETRRARSLLMHTADREKEITRSKVTRMVRVPRKRTVGDAVPVKYFPDKRIWDLLENGFAVPSKQKSRWLHERLNIRDIMISVLMHGGGLRESEPFHLFVSDVSIDPTNPKSALVKLYHPEQGAAPDDYIDPLVKKRIEADREEYLRVKWGMEPRSLVVGKLHAGWKDLHMTDERRKYAQIHWFPTFWGEVFLELFKVYITKLRSRHARHPFLFVSQKDDVAGEPYTISAFRQAHAKAVKRVGLKVGKDFGTTPHGHRHTYGQLLTDAKLDPLLIQRCLHHKSKESQQVYTGPSVESATRTLREASDKLGFSNHWVRFLSDGK
jgi:hypothetical protein